MSERQIAPEEMTRLVQKGGPVEGVDLSHLDLSDSDHDGIRFDRCTARRAQFTGAQIGGSHWVGCQVLACAFASGQLQGAVFEECRFFDSETSVGGAFRFCNMADVRFVNCDLSLATFKGCDLHNIAFESCRMRGVGFEKTEFVRSFGPRVVRTSACFENCNLENASLPNVNLSGCELKSCDFAGADLTRANLSNADMTGCDLTDAELEDADLSGADLRDGKLHGLQLHALRGYAGLMISADQQHLVLRELGIDVSPD